MTKPLTLPNCQVSSFPTVPTTEFISDQLLWTENAETIDTFRTVTLKSKHFPNDGVTVVEVCVRGNNPQELSSFCMVS